MKNTYFPKLASPLTGVLRCDWLYSNGDLSAIIYGTAILISPRVILTCAHNIHSEYRKRLCDRAYFIPNIDSTRLNSQKRYEILDKNSFKYKWSGYPSFRPLGQELALILLPQVCQYSNDQQNLQFPSVGSLSQNYQNIELKMLGYPSQRYFNIPEMESIFPKRVQLEGNVYSVIQKQNTIHHTMKTGVGFSGSPIFAKSPQGQYFICGIHTHRGLTRQYSSGLYFTPCILQQLEIYFLELKQQNRLQDQLNVMSSVDDQSEWKLTIHAEDQDDNKSIIQCHNGQIYFDFQKNYHFDSEEEKYSR